jgi:transcriptional regulator with XRE-family HTH domain
MSEKFDSEGFYAALNAERLSRQMTWKEVAEEAGVNASTLTRMGQGNKPDVNGLAALLSWSKLKAEMFIRGSDSEEPQTLTMVTALLRADPNLSSTHAQIMEDIVVHTYRRLQGG